MVAWDSVIRTRYAVEEPLSIDLLLSRLDLLVVHGVSIDAYVSADQVNCKCQGLAGNAHCLHNFFDLGGVLISSPLCKLWHNRCGFLLVSNFWRLWDVIAFSGWITISMSSFRTTYNLNEVQCDNLIPLLPMLDPLVECDLFCDDLSRYSVGYSLFRDFLNLFKHFISIDRWGFGSTNNLLTDAVNAQFVEYHVKLLDLMITRRSQTCDILSVMLDVNLWGVCKSSTIYHLCTFVDVVNDPIESTQCRAMLLVLRSSFIFSISAHYCNNIMKFCSLEHS